MKITDEMHKQLALDVNCSPKDFLREGIVFTEAKKIPGRRPFDWGEPHFEMFCTGRSVVVMASKELLPFLREQLAGKDRDEAFEMPFVVGAGLFYLPDIKQTGEQMIRLPLSPDFDFEFIGQKDIPAYYAETNFKNAMQYDVNHPRPDVLLTIARKGRVIAGMAGASIDCEMLWQIGIDVLPEFRNCGIAAVLVNMLAAEILDRGKIPYYGTAFSNMASQRVAHRAGFRPAWICSWRGKFGGELTEPTC